MGKKATAILILVIIGASLPDIVAAQSVNDLKKKIDDKAQVIKNLEQEISKYQKQVEETAEQAATLNSSIKVLDTSRKQLETSITSTGAKIDKTSLTIQQLSQEIQEKEARIATNKLAVAESLRHIHYTGSDSVVELVLRHDSLSTAWDDVVTNQQFESTLRVNSAELLALKQSLEKNYASTEEKKKELLDLQKDLASKKSIVEETKKEKGALLAETKDKESNFKKILQDKVALKKAFEKELRDFESQLNIKIDVGRLPTAGSGVLSWPLDQIVITQHFGDTEFARSGAYNGSGHNGVDFKAPTGTRVKSAQSGTVQGVGDTDGVCPKASYGKWVLVRHTNGLSTLYAHLSLISVASGQSVSAGDILGYSGTTGYSTGPHLHFTVYATQGVQIVQRKSAVCGGTYTMPVADLKAYLPPLQYL
jgi:murein DD-endopeptidase MepM/ murein hydrolase activator NlpD